MHADPFTEETSPEGHWEHVVEVLLPSVLEAFPGSHVVHATAVPKKFEYFPAGQGRQEFPPGANNLPPLGE